MNSLETYVELARKRAQRGFARVVQASYRSYLFVRERCGGITLPAFTSPLRVGERRDSYMPPARPANGASDGFSGHSITNCNLALSNTARSVKKANRQNIVSRELGSADSFTTGTAFGKSARTVPVSACCIQSASGFAIIAVIGIASAKQVKRIAAWWKVALMPGQVAAGVNAVEDVIGNAVRSQCSPLDLVLSVTAGKLARLPRPAFLLRTTFDFLPEIENRLRGQFRRDRIRFSHKLNLLKATFSLWLDPYQERNFLCGSICLFYR